MPNLSKDVITLIVSEIFTPLDLTENILVDETVDSESDVELIDDEKDIEIWF